MATADGSTAGTLNVLSLLLDILSSVPMSSGTARLMRSFVLRCVGLPLLVLVLAVRVLVNPVTCRNTERLHHVTATWQITALLLYISSGRGYSAADGYQATAKEKGLLPSIHRFGLLQLVIREQLGLMCHLYVC